MLVWHGSDVLYVIGTLFYLAGMNFCLNGKKIMGETFPSCPPGSVVYGVHWMFVLGCFATGFGCVTLCTGFGLPPGLVILQFFIVFAVIVAYGTFVGSLVKAPGFAGTPKAGIVPISIGMILLLGNAVKNWSAFDLTENEIIVFAAAPLLSLGLIFAYSSRHSEDAWIAMAETEME